jgi:hypothetical protein
MEDLKPRAGLMQQVPETVWAAAVSAAGLGLLGLLGWTIGSPLIFASLGPTLFLLALQPADPTTRIYNTMVGHLAGLGTAALSAWATGAIHAPPMNIAEPLPGARLAAAILALSATIVCQKLLHAPHVPAAATALLFALGTLPLTRRSVLLFIGAVAVTAIFGEIFRRARKGPVTPTPLPRASGET